MAKIPRLDPSVPQAAVPRGGGGNVNAGLPEIIGSAVRLGDTVTGLAADAEKREALKRQQAMEAKQAVKNEVYAGVQAGDYEEALISKMAELEETHAAMPEKAPEALLEFGRAQLGQRLEAASNSEEGLAFAQRANSRLDSAMEKAHAWALRRQTQLIKTGLDDMVNEVSQQARRMPDTASLEAFLKAQEAELKPKLAWVKNPADLQKALDDMWKNSTEDWVHATTETDPVRALSVLDETKGVIAQKLNTDTRATLRSQARQAIEGLGRIREQNIARDYFSRNPDIHDAFIGGTLDAVYVRQLQRAIEKRRETIMLDPKATPEMRVRENELLNRQAKYIEALSSIRRRQLPQDFEDDPKVAAEIWARLNELTAHKGKKAGENLAEWYRLQTDLGMMAADKKLTVGSYQTAFQKLALAFPKAMTSAEVNTGLLAAFEADTPEERAFQIGNAELNGRFDGAMISAATMNAVRERYTRRHNEFRQAGARIDGAVARRMAQEAFVEITGRRIPGVYEKGR